MYLILRLLTYRVTGRPVDAIECELEAMGPLCAADDGTASEMSDAEPYIKIISIMNAGLAEHGKYADLRPLLADAGHDLARKALRSTAANATVTA